MWAHYASQHKGMVIGLEDDFLCGEYSKEKITSNLIHSPNPIKITYDTTRFDLTEFDTLLKNMTQLSKLLAIKLLTTKSDDWIYEKEHRCIVPIGVADKILYIGKTSERTRKIKD
nr:DUF2971 domain-containing protein [Aeromonas hydrophila]